MSNPKIIVFSLTKRGCVEYAEHMILSLPDVIVVASKDAILRTGKKEIKIQTYNHSIDFVFKTIWFILSFHSLLRRLIREYGKNMIFYFPVFHPWNLIIGIYAKFFGIKSVITVHDFVQHLGEKNVISNWFQQKNMSIADKIIFLSRSELDKMNWTKLKTKSVVLPHPILRFFQMAPMRIFHQEPNVLFLGRISAYKGLNTLLSGFENFKNNIKKLTIAGEIMDFSIAIKENDKLKLLNYYLPNSEVRNLLSNHHILVLPYIDASQSGVLTLGIDSCIPMIISDLPGLREQLNDSSCAYWVKPGSSEDINKAIQWYSIKENYENVVENLKQFKSRQNQDIGKKLLEVLYYN